MVNRELVERQFDIDIDELLEGKKLTQIEIQERIKYVKETYKLNKIHRVCCFGRVSTKHEEQEMSLFTQRTMFHEYIGRREKDGYVLVEEIYDRQSATLASKRPKFLNMIERAKRGEFDILLFKDSKRFSRNTEDFLSLLEQLKNLGVYVIFMSEGVSTEKADRTTLTVLGMIAESHSNGLHNSVNAAMLVNMERDEGRMAARTFGYDKPVVNDSRIFSINEEEAKLIKEVFVRLANMEGPTSIVDDFRNRGIKTKYGKQFTTLAIMRIARNKKYIGILEMHKDTRSDVRSERKKLDESEWIVRYREDLRIIDDELFYKVQSILDGRSNKEYADKFKTIRTRPFTGLIRCECCGKNLIRVQGGHKPKGYYTYFQCTTSRDRKKTANVHECDNTKTFRESTLLDVMRVYVTQMLEGREDLEKLIESRVAYIIKKYKEEINKTSENVVDIKALKEKFKRAKELFIEGLCEKADVEKAHAELVKAEKESMGANLSSLNDINVKALCKKFFSNLEELVQSGMTLDNVNGMMLNSLFESITANSNGELDIVFNLAGCNDVVIDSCSHIINGGGCIANNYQICQLDLAEFIDWERVNSDMNDIRTSSPVYLQMHKFNRRYKAVGNEQIDKVSIMV